jgi:hypothetical protein
MIVSERLPRFLVVSPPKTGSTWLADNLRQHPCIFVPDIKEVKYFSSLCKWLDMDWYCSHFDPADGRMAGEASPSYAALPVERIRAIRNALPEVKIVFLMRDPVSRAWSHAKHMHRYREGPFTNCETPLDQVADDEWRAAFEDDWLLASGDYLGQLRRWLSVFPRNQIHIGFFESIVERPAEVLREVFSFLGVDRDLELTGFPLTDRVLPGPDGTLPPQLEDHLRTLLGERTEELTAWLRENAIPSPPAAWNRTLAARGPRECPDFESIDLARIAAQEDTFRTSYRQLLLDYRGYDLQFYRGRLLAIPTSLGPPQNLDGPLLERAIHAGVVLTAGTFAELKDAVTTRVLETQAERMNQLERELQTAREIAARLRIDLQTLVHEVRYVPPPLWNRGLLALRRRISRAAGSTFGFWRSQKGGTGVLAGASPGWHRSPDRCNNR